MTRQASVCKVFGLTASLSLMAMVAWSSAGVENVIYVSVGIVIGIILTRIFSRDDFPNVSSGSTPMCGS
jgi:hypothetical protein